MPEPNESAQGNVQTATEKPTVYDRTKELTDRLEAGIKDLFQSDKFKDYLKSMSHFHHYSSKNIMLINMQRPGATRIASFKLWDEKFNRHVKKGEHGIRIFAPVADKTPEKKMFEKLDPETGAPLLDKDGKVIMEEMTELTSGIRFKLVPVFDVSQTYGEPLPELAENLTGNVAHYAAFMDALKTVSPLPIVFEPLADGHDGYCRYGEKIGIREGMSEIQTVSAVIHEITHARLHAKGLENADVPKFVKEVQAESVSYVVCQHYGIETAANSFGYVAEYNGRDMTEFKASLDVIRKEASGLITAVSDQFKAICQERGIDLTAKTPETPAVPDKTPEPEYITETRTENIAGVDFAVEDIIPKTPEHENYRQFAALFPQVASGEYGYLRLEAGAGMEPLSLEWIGDDRISIMHTYTQNGDLCYGPMMVFAVNKDLGTMTAVEFEQSIPPLYQIVDEDGRGRSIDGNGREQTLQNLQMSLNGFASQWFDNIGQQDYQPVRANAEIDGEVTQITFDKDGKPVLPEPEADYNLGFGPDNNGVAVWNWNEPNDENGNEKFIAHINKDREITFLADDLPDNVKADIENIAAGDWKEMFAIEMAGMDYNPVNPGEMPDPAISFSEMNLYGYQYENMLPLLTERALELFDQDQPVYLLYPDNTEALAFERSEIENHDGIFGIESGDWQRILDYTAQMAKNAEAAKESGLINGNTDMFGIYQLKGGDDLHYHRFASLKQLESDHLAVDRSNYELAYTAPLPPKETLDDIYRQFNADHPKDFTGHSLSVSDVIVIQRGGEVSSHYVDNFGFAELPAFLGNERQPERTAPPEQNNPVGDTTPEKPAPTAQDNKAAPDISDIQPSANKPKAVYMQSPDHAREHGELDRYRESLKLNKECAAAIDAAIKDCILPDGHGYRLTPESVSKVMDVYGEQRVIVVLANTVRLQEWDGRYSGDTKAWAKAADLPQVRDNRDYFSAAHPAVLDGYIRLARKETEKKPSVLDALKQGADKIKQTPAPQKEPPQKNKNGLEV